MLPVGPFPALDLDIVIKLRALDGKGIRLTITEGMLTIADLYTFGENSESFVKQTLREYLAQLVGEVHR